MSGFQSYPGANFQRVVPGVTNGPSVTSYTYNVDGSLATETEANGMAYSYGYNGDGSLHTITSSDGTVTTFSYDESGNLTGQSVA